MFTKKEKIIIFFLTFLFLIFLTLFIFFISLYAAVPATINYQGRLRQSGLPVTGTQTMRFKLYDALTGGTVKWDSGDVSNISVTNGIFSYQLGLTDGFSVVDWTAGPYYLETIIGATVLSPREQLSSSVYAFYASNASVNGLTPSRALVSNASGVLTVSNVTSTELGYVSGVTSPIQTQLNTKAPTASPTFTGSVTMPGTGIWNSSGRVGIGTTSPGNKFEVSGGSVNVVSPGRILQAGAALLPPGAIIQYGGSTAPNGWLMCNGASVLRSTYADLFAILGTTYGSADGSHFNLPDLRGRVPVGVDGSAGRVTASNALGNSGGEEKHTLLSTEAAMRAHSHQWSENGAGTGNITGGTGDRPSRASVAVDTSFRTGVTLYATGTYGSSALNLDAPNAHNNLQPYLIVNYIIKY